MAARSNKMVLRGPGPSVRLGGWGHLETRRWMSRMVLGSELVRPSAIERLPCQRGGSLGRVVEPSHGGALKSDAMRSRPTDGARRVSSEPIPPAQPLCRLRLPGRLRGRPSRPSGCRHARRGAFLADREPRRYASPSTWDATNDEIQSGRGLTPVPTARPGLGRAYRDGGRRAMHPRRCSGGTSWS